MSNWSEILTEVNQSFPTNIDLLNKKRKEYMDQYCVKLTFNRL